MATSGPIPGVEGRTERDSATHRTITSPVGKECMMRGMSCKVFHGVSRMVENFFWNVLPVLYYIRAFYEGGSKRRVAPSRGDARTHSSAWALADSGGPGSLQRPPSGAAFSHPEVTDTVGRCRTTSCGKLRSRLKCAGEHLREGERSHEECVRRSRMLHAFSRCKHRFHSCLDTFIPADSASALP